MSQTETCILPAHRRERASSQGPSSREAKKPWQSRRSLFRSKDKDRDQNESQEQLSRENTRTSTVGIMDLAKETTWWKVQLFRGMINDVRRRAPFYLSDWKDAWDYRVVPATIYMYFAKYVRYRKHLRQNTLPKPIQSAPQPSYRARCSVHLFIVGGRFVNRTVST